MTKTPKRPAHGLPDKETLVRFLREAGEADKADIARAFGLKGEERRMLREMLKTLEAEGRLGKRGRKGCCHLQQSARHNQHGSEQLYAHRARHFDYTG